MNLADIIADDLRNAKDRASIDTIGQEAAQDEEKGRWRLAALVNLLDRAYGKSAIVDFAKVVNRKRSYIYEAGQVYGFYGPAQVFELVEPNEEGNRVITFSHMRDAMRAYRKLHPEDRDLARDEALQWLDVVAGDLMTVEQAGRKLKERLGIVSAPPFKGTGIVRQVGERHVFLVFDTSKFPFAEGDKVTFSIRAECVQGDE